MIPQIEPSFGREEADALHNYVMRGGWLTEYKYTRYLEYKIAQFLGVKHCLMTPSGTLALYAALMGLGIGPGDEVIVPAFTMIATAEAVRMVRAIPVLVDVRPDNFCLDPNVLHKVISKRTKAIIAVALNGRSADLEKVCDIAHDAGIKVIEDAAQALGSYWRHYPLGTAGDVGCFSFSPHKIISTGQGGCVVTDDSELNERILRLRNFGRVSSGGQDHDVFGVNLKFTDLQAVVGLEQMRKLPDRIKRKREIFARYQERLGALPNIAVLDTDLTRTTPWYVDILVPTPYRDYLKAFLSEKCIMARPFYPAIHQTGAYAHLSRQVFPNAEAASFRGLWLPSSVSLTDDQIDMVCDAVEEWASA